MRVQIDLAREVAAKGMGMSGIEKREQNAHFALDRGNLRSVWGRWKELTWNVGMQAMFSRMLELNLTMSEQMALRRLRNGTTTVAAMAETMGITPSAASRSVDRLVRDGLVERAESLEDRRQRILSLSEQGAALMDQLDEGMLGGVERVVALLSDSEQVLFRDLLARMVETYELEEA